MIRMESIESCGVEASPKRDLRNVLPAGFSEKHIGIDEKHWWEFEDALNSVVRWQDEYSNEYVAEETVFEHVYAMLAIINDIEDNYPKLASAIKLDDVRLMTLIHDLGETLRGDVPYTMRESKSKNKSKFDFEKLFAVRILKRAPEGKKEKLIDLYQRQHERREDDAEAHFMKFLDVLQGEMFGQKAGIFEVRARYNYGYEGSGNTPKPEYYKNLCDGVIDALADKKDAIGEFKELVNTMLLSENALAGHYPSEAISDLKYD